MAVRTDGRATKTDGLLTGQKGVHAATQAPNGPQQIIYEIAGLAAAAPIGSDLRKWIVGWGRAPACY